MAFGIHNSNYAKLEQTFWALLGQPLKQVLYSPLTPSNLLGGSTIMVFLGECSDGGFWLDKKNWLDKKCLELKQAKVMV